MKLQILTCLFVIAAHVSFAGDWGKAPVPKVPIEECLDLGATISAGYRTDYILHGVRFARDSVWTELDYTYDGLALPVTMSVWYLNGINGSRIGNQFDELDLRLSAAAGSVAGFDVNFGYTHRIFPEFRSAFAEIGGFGQLDLGLRRSLGFVDVAFDTHYAMGGGGAAPSGWYHQLGAYKNFGISDAVSLVFGAGVGYSDGYWGGSGWNHYFLNATLPIELNCRTTLTPYVGYNGSPDTWIADGIIGAGQAQSDILHGGVSLNVSF